MKCYYCENADKDKDYKYKFICDKCFAMGRRLPQAQKKHKVVKITPKQKELTPMEKAFREKWGTGMNL